jgi:hypothetical protein
MGCSATLTNAGPGGRSVNGMESVGRVTKFPLSSFEDELNESNRTPCAREQNDNSNIATAACFSGSNVIFWASGGLQKIELALAPVDAFTRLNLPWIILEMGTKFESMNICESEFAVSLM